MSEDTTTSDDQVVPSPEEAQVDDQVDNTEAVTDDEDTSQTSETDSEESSTEDDSAATELKEWVAKKNLPLDDPLAIAKMYRESEQKLGRKGQKEGQLKNAVTTANTEAGTEDYQALRNEVEALSFYVNHPEAKTFEAEMVTILEEKPYLAGDLDAVLDMAKGRTITDAASLLAANKAGRKEALAQAEQAGRAAQPRVSATNAAKASANKITPANVDAVIGQHMGDAAWYKKNKPAIDAALAG